MNAVELIGAESVRAAGNQMRQAADQMSGAASSIDAALERHQRFMDDWLQRFADVLQQATDSFVTVRAPANEEINPIQPPAGVEGPEPVGAAPLPPKVPLCKKSPACCLPDGHVDACDDIPF